MARRAMRRVAGWVALLWVVGCLLGAYRYAAAHPDDGQAPVADPSSAPRSARVPPPGCPASRMIQGEPEGLSPAAPAQPPAAAAPGPAAAPAHGRADREENPGPGATFVPAVLCSAPACHGSLVAQFDQLRHSHYLLDPSYGDKAGCGLCHGPASEHVVDPAHGKIPYFAVQTRENARRINEACLRCHQEQVNRTHYLAAQHARAGLSCATCHEVHYDLKTPYMLRLPGVDGPAGQPQRERGSRQAHGPSAGTSKPGAPAAPAPAAAALTATVPRLEMLAKTRVPPPNWRTSFPREPDAITKEEAVNELCVSCHRRLTTELRQFSHHPVLEGRLGCTGCHDPHHEREGRMLREESTADTCLQCHQDKRGPFVFEHDPVKSGGVGEACLECHRPHGSPNRDLETMVSRGLCLQCHTDIAQDPKHRARGGDCWRSNCHVAVHGSNHSRTLLTD